MVKIQHSNFVLLLHVLCNMCTCVVSSTWCCDGPCCDLDMIHQPLSCLMKIQQISVLSQCKFIQLKSYYLYRNSTLYRLISGGGGEDNVITDQLHTTLICSILGSQ